MLLTNLVKHTDLKCQISKIIARQFHRPTLLNSSISQLKKLNRNDSEVIAQKLRCMIGDKNVSLAEAVRSQHGQDEGPDKGEMPDVVVFAESTEHVSEVSILKINL